MVTHTQNLCSAFNPSKVHTHSSEHTNTHCEHIGQPFYAAAPGEHLGVQCLAQGHLNRGIEGEASAGHYKLDLQFLPARDSNSQPFECKPDSLTIRPRLPHEWLVKQFAELESDRLIVVTLIIECITFIINNNCWNILKADAKFYSKLEPMIYSWQVKV